MEKKMRFEEFVNTVVEKIKEYLPATFKDASVETQVVVKGNDMTMTGLTIRSEGSTICPMIYLEEFFEVYQAGEEMKAVLEKIAEIRVGTEIPDALFDIDQILRFDQAKERIVPRVVGREWNELLLQQRPYTEIEDLAVTYHILMGQGENGISSIPVTNEMMKSWGTDAEELHKVALSNMKSLLPTTFRGMSSVMKAMVTGEEEGMALDGFDPSDEAMFILSNRENMFGATAILDKGIMERIAEAVGEAYILPSSIHEMLIVPKTADMDASDLVEMVRTANESVVMPKDRLSNHIYRYEKGEGLRIVA